MLLLLTPFFFHSVFVPTCFQPPPLPHFPRMHHFSRKRLSNKKSSTILFIFLPVIIFFRKQSCRNKSLYPPFPAATACLPPRRTQSPTQPRAVRTRRRDIRCLSTMTMTSRACLRPLLCPHPSTHPFCVRVTFIAHSFITHGHPLELLGVFYADLLLLVLPPTRVLSALLVCSAQFCWSLFLLLLPYHTAAPLRC